MNPYYPLFLNINKKKCAVIGGGTVALRKIEAFLEHGARVTVISPDLCPELDELASRGKVVLLRRRYRSGDLEGAYVAIAASSDNDVNIQVEQEARKRRVLVNVVDEPALSDFIVPSSLVRGDITIAISTGGGSPALARKIRVKLEKEFGDEYAVLAVLVAKIRAELLGKDVRIEGDKWQEAIDLDALIDLIKNDEVDKARSMLRIKLQNSRPSGTGN